MRFAILPGSFRFVIIDFLRVINLRFKYTFPLPARPILLILLVLSIAVSTCVLFAVKYDSATLVLFARTYEKGVRLIHVENAGEIITSNMRFEIGNDDGDYSLYPVELPAKRIKTIQIPPLASQGKFHVDKISLQYGLITYSWDDQGRCQQQGLRNNVMHRESCYEGVPALSMAADSSVVISSIPESVMEKSTELRFSIALVSALLLFAGGIWFFRPLEAVGRLDHLWQYGARLLWLLIAALFINQYIQVWKYAVDLPFCEEWRYFEPDALPQGLTWNWLVGFYGEHRVLFTKFLAWINLKLFGLDFMLLTIQNYLLYGGVFLVLIRLKKLVIGNREFILYPAFLIFMFSSKWYENLFWAFSSQIHFVLMFSLLALTCAFPDDRGKRCPIQFIVYSACAIYSFASGVVMVGTLLVFTSIHAYYVTRPADRRVLNQLVIAWIVLGCLLFAWFGEYSNSLQLVFLDDVRFWSFFLGLISLGFGFSHVQTIIGLFCITVCILPLIIILFKKEARRRYATWIVVTASAMSMLTLATMSTGRAASPIAASWRYAETGFMLIPITALAWWLALESTRWRGLVLVLFWVLCFVGYFDDWTPSPYKDIKQTSLLTLECVEGYINGTGDGNCPDMITSSPSQAIDSARRLRIHFTRQFAAPNGVR